MSDKTKNVCASVLGKTIERPLGPDDAQETVLGSLARIDLLLRALPAELQANLSSETLTKIANPESSLRKTEKGLRQALIARLAVDKQAELARVLPGVSVTSLGGTLRFSRPFELTATVGERPYRMQYQAQLVGGPAEIRFLTENAESVAPFLLDELEKDKAATLETETAAAAELHALIVERRARTFYDVRGLERITSRALRNALFFCDALEDVLHHTRSLDRESDEKNRVRELIRDNGLVSYKDFFPRARSLRRELVFYAGPTNSGKTYHALNDLVQGTTGAYLAPLRLLALEGQAEIEKRGKASSFLTGEERDIREDAGFVASTIEMLDTSREVDAVLIDEVQMLTDRDRGWAWCQALAGAPAKRVLMTGSPDAIPLVEAIAEYLGEPLTIHHLERHTPIEALPRAMRIEDIQPGTAVIAFSRREVLRLKAELERRYSVATIYGNLTPQVRREEARRFREGEAHVLVATDAIAMGLNLPTLQCVVLSSLTKFDGEGDVDLEPWQILQIGGRAGRFGFFDKGYVAGMNAFEHRRIQEVFAPSFTPPEREIRTSVRPSADHIEVIASGLGTDSLAAALSAFQRSMSFDTDLLVPGVQDDMITLANVADRYSSELTLDERLRFACAPVDTGQEWLVDEYASWVEAYAFGSAVPVEPMRSTYLKERAAHDEELLMAEQQAKLLTLYAWMAFRYPETFPDSEECQRQRVTLDGFIERTLSHRIRERVTTEGATERRGRRARR